MNRQLLAFVTMCIASVGLASQWTLTTSDFQQQDGALRQMDESGVETDAARVPWDRIVSLDQRVVDNIKSSDPFILYTRDGQQLRGEPTAVGDESLSWKGMFLKQMRVPLEDVKGLARSGVSLPPQEDNEDRVVLQNGDILSGIIAPADGGVAVQKGSVATPVKWDAIRALTLAQVSNQPASPAEYRVRLADGSVFLAKSVHTDQDEIHIVPSRGAEVPLPMQVVRSVQNEAGRVRFLVSRPPLSQEYVPYVATGAESDEGIKCLDQASVGGREYRNVLQMRPRSRVVYKSPFDGTVHLRYACGNSGRFTDMSVRVIVAGRVISDAASVKSPEAGAVIEAPVAKDEEVTIEVGFGANYDVQDFLWLLDAAFVAK